jgi:Domain of unknown function (DUF4129)
VIATALRAVLEPDRQQARSWAERELLGKEYQAQRPGPLQQLLNWIVDKLNGVSAPHLFGAPLGLAIVAGLVLAIVGYVVWRSGGVNRQARAASAELFGGQARSADDHRAAAAAAEANGDLGTAALERFRALIRALADRDLVQLAPGRTADEAARSAGEALPELAADLRAAARIFDDVRFGDRQATREQVATLRELDTRALATRPRPVLT